MTTTSKTVTPETRIISPVVIVRTMSCVLRLHRKGCRDVAREAATNGHGSLWDDMDGFDSLWEYAQSTFCDVACDTYEPGTVEHDEEAWGDLISDLQIMPCAQECLSS